MLGLLQVVPSVPKISRRCLSYHEVTSRFLEFFEGRRHTIVPSSPLLAPPESGLLFTNSGMNQFHRILSGNETPTVKRVASLQDCVRVGGKHNDLLEVGHDGHHHTFFQMLGNWSFGDYFKEEACIMAVELLTHGYGLKKENLIVTYFGGDSEQGIPPDFETKEIWHRLGLTEDTVTARGYSENFWEMGKTGPCGPCTEIHVVVDGQLREIWNLVFIQYNRMSDGSLKPLNTPFVDTGMGLERLCALLQGKSSNYDTDLFAPLIQYLEKESGKSYTGSFTSPEDAAFRLVADHCRMATKAIAQGILPEHDDAGNKLRRVLRRAGHAAHDRLRLEPGTIGTLSVIAADLLHVDEADRIKAVIDDEERRYFGTIKKANRYLQEEGEVDTLSGSTAWKLYQICGLPRDNIVDICSQRGIKNVDWARFDEHFEEFKQKSVGPNAIAKFDLPKHVDAVMERKLPITNYAAVYADQYEMVSDVLYSAQEGPYCVLVTRESCFYPEGGGQVSDTGSITSRDTELKVTKVLKRGDHLYHLCEGPSPPESSSVCLKVDQLRRKHCTQHHTAAHLLNAALKGQLGYLAVQRSSLVDDEHFRIDIVSKTAIDVRAAEDFVNDIIKTNLVVQCDEVQREDILNDPTITKLPNEIYPPRVRLIQCGGVSREPCCGTHVAATGEIPPIVVVSSKSVGVNVKSITATASRACLARANAEKLKKEIEKLENFSETLSDDFRSTFAVREQLRSLRASASAQLLSQLNRTDALKRLDAIDVRVSKSVKLSNKIEEPRVRSKLMAISGSPAVGTVSLDCDEVLVRRIMRERAGAQCVILDSCGNLHFLFRVTKSESFTAPQWAASFLDSIGSPQNVAQESTDFFHRCRMKSNLPSEQLEQALKVAFDKLKNDGKAMTEMREK